MENLLVTGIIFKEFVPNGRFVKLIDNNKLEDFKIPLVENSLNKIDILKTAYANSDHCFISGGIKFGNLNNCIEYFTTTYYSDFICTVEIPDDAHVYIDEKGCMIANQLYFGKFQNLYEFENNLIERDENYMTAVLIKYPELMEKLNDVPEKVVLEFIKRTPHNIKYVKNATEEMNLIVVKSSPYLLRVIKNPSLNVIAEAVKIAPYVINDIGQLNYDSLVNLVEMCPEIIGHINNLDEEIYKRAVGKNGELLKHIHNQHKTKEICDIAFNNTPYALPYIPDEYLSYEKCIAAVNFDPFLLKYISDEFFSTELCLNAVTKNGLAIQCIVNPFQEACVEAIKNNKAAIFHITDPTDEMYLMVLDEYPHLSNRMKNTQLLGSYDHIKFSLKHDPKLFLNIKNPTYDQCLECLKITSRIFQFLPTEFLDIEELGMIALEDDPWLLKYMSNQTENMCLVAVMKDPLTILSVLNQTEDICMVVVEAKGDYIKFVDHKTDKLCFAALKQDIDSYKHMDGVKLSQETLLYLARTRPTYIIDMIDDPYLNQLDEDLEELVIEAINQDPKLIQNIPYHQTEKICKTAINKDPETIIHITNKTDELIKLALRKNGLLLKHIKDQTYEQCEIAIQNNPMSLEFVIDQIDSLCILAILLNYKALKCIREQKFEHCLTAVSKNFYAIKLIKDQNEMICKSCTCINPRCANFITNIDMRKECQALVEEIKELL